MNRFCFIGLAAVSLCLPILRTGCVVDRPLPVEVQGAVTYDGEPVPAGVASFVAAADGDALPSGGGAIADGRYHVYPEAGLKPGKYRVEFRWGKATGEKNKDAGYGQSPDIFAEGLPKKYHVESILTAELRAGMNSLEFNLEK